MFVLQKRLLLDVLAAIDFTTIEVWTKGGLARTIYCSPPQMFRIPRQGYSSSRLMTIE